MDIAAFVVSIVAALIAAGAWWESRRSATAATTSASEAVAAGERARAAEQRREADEQARRVVWVIEHVDNALYVLRNEGTDTAQGTAIGSEHASVIQLVEPVGIHDVVSGGQIGFYYSPSYNDLPLTQVRVIWADEPDGRLIAMGRPDASKGGTGL